MSTYTYGQKEPMENEAMARTLSAQATAIWPQEKLFLSRIVARRDIDVLDVGCGTGEISSRILKEFGTRSVVGIDLAEPNLARAKWLFPPPSYPGLSFQQGNAIALPFDDNRFDVALCRHMLQAVPDPLRVIKEMIRVVKPGGWLYFLAEDYGMLFFYPTKFDTDQFWRDYGWKAGEKSGSNLRQGRTMPTTLTVLGCSDLELQYLCIDTLRVDRTVLGDIFTHWRDGFEVWMSENTSHSLEDVHARFNDIIDCTRNPNGYAAWLLPSMSARVTEESKKRARG